MPSRRTSESKPRKSAAPTPPAESASAPPVPTPETASPKKRALPKARPVEVTPRAVVTEEMRRGMIAEAAYLRAERRGFSPGSEDEDWLAAEKEVDRLLAVDDATRPQ